MTGQELMDAATLPASGHVYLRVRESHWANPQAYARVSVLTMRDGRSLGPWLHLFDRVTQELIGEPTPQAVAWVMLPNAITRFLMTEQEVYTGPLDPTDG